MYRYDFEILFGWFRFLTIFACVSIPLAIWKLVDIIIWIIGKII